MLNLNKKHLICILVIVLINTVAVSQNNNLDVIYLKSGSIIKGLIIEEIPNLSIKIKTKDGSIFVYLAKDIEKIGKEINAVNKYEKQGTTKKAKLKKIEHGHFSGIYLGSSFGLSYPISDFQISHYGAPKPISGSNFAIDFNFRSKSFIGLAVKLNHSVIKCQNFASSYPYRITNYLIGPTFLIPVTLRTFFEVRPTFGLSYVVVPDIVDVNGNYWREYKKAGVLCGEIYFQTNLTKKLFIYFNPNIFITKPKMDFYGRSTFPIQIISGSIGLTVKLK